MKIIDEKYAITSDNEVNMRMRIEWLEKGMDKISRYCNHNKKLPYVNSRVYNHFSKIEDEITLILDGEPVTYNNCNKKGE